MIKFLRRHAYPQLPGKLNFSKVFERRLETPVLPINSPAHGNLTVNPATGAIIRF